MNDNYEEELRIWLKNSSDEPLETMSGFFEARIDSYEAHMERWTEHYRRISELLPQSTENLIDIGCGTGLELDFIYKRFPNLKVTGVDLSAKMLAKLREKHGDKCPTLVCGDYFVCDLGDDIFDAALAFETLHHYKSEKKTEIFKKIFRSLKPGGVFFDCDYIALTQGIESMLFEECRTRRIRNGIQDDTFVHFDTPLTLEHETEAIKSAGFSKIELVEFLPSDDHTAIIKAIK